MESQANLVKAIAQAVAEEQARLRWLVMSVVSGALKLSETELMDATRDLMSLQHEARQSADSLRDASSLVGREADVVSQVFTYQTRYADEATARLRQQVDNADRAMYITDQIGAFVGEIGKISNAVRVLTINGYIESTRLGGEGRAFAVIAEQLQELGEKVRSANEGIRDLTASLGKLIPQIGDGARALMRTTEQLKSEHTDAMFMFQGASSANQREMSGALQEAQDRATRIASRAAQILGHLQFQDRMAQQLRELEHLSMHTERVLAAMFDQLSGAPVSESDVDDALQLARQTMPRQRGGRPGQGAEPAPRQANGEVLLFE